MIKDLLPIGSIVLLKDAKKKLMITGIKQTGAENTEYEHDYVGVFYPEGHIGERYNFLFDHKDIEEIIFRGYEDEERQAFLERLDMHYQNSTTITQ